MRIGKKASIRDVLIVVVVFFVVMMGFFLMNFTTKTITTAMKNNTQIASVPEAVTSLDSTSNMVDRLDYLGFGLLIGLLLAMMIAGYFVGGNRIFMFVYFIIIILAVIVSAVLSNVWGDVTGLSTIFGTTISAFPLSNHIIGNFPIYTAIAGFIGIISMFAKPTTE